MKQLVFKYKFWLEDQNGTSIFGDGKYRLLQAIEETGSFKYAVDKLKLSYRKTWDNLRKIEERLGYPIIETQQGGALGGATRITPKGKKLMEAFETLHAQCDPAFQEILKKLPD
ncbi:MAG: LysR family transcriptional regulator [Bacteroidales bacterium]|nr:LysR family transcriptional regulator [Bacteroidales bacterium]